MLKLERRPEASELWRYGSPLLALLITVALGIGLFVLLGKDPVRGLQMFFLGAPEVCLCFGRTDGEGNALVDHCLGLGCLFSLQCLEHWC
jgi:general nucleoside transport system permease protein